MYKPTAGATNSGLTVLTLRITNNNPKVATTYEIYKFNPLLEFTET